MVSKAAFLQALDDKTGETARVLISDNVQDDIKKLFEKIFEKSFADIKWGAGVPGKDPVVVWQGTSYQGTRDHWLHVGYSDGRLW